MTKQKKKARDNLFSASEKEKQIQKQVKDRLKKYVNRGKDNRKDET